MALASEASEHSDGSQCSFHSCCEDEKRRDSKMHHSQSEPALDMSRVTKENIHGA
jgi:hypothetical protein